MKKISFVLVITTMFLCLFSFGCNTFDNGDKFVGKWQKVGSSSTMIISKSGDGYVDRENDGDHKAVYENGRLKIQYHDDYFYATINESGNLVLGGREEYKKVN